MGKQKNKIFFFMVIPLQRLIQIPSRDIQSNSQVLFLWKSATLMVKVGKKKMEMGKTTQILSSALSEREEPKEDPRNNAINQG